MIKEAKNINFYTSGRQPSEQDFACISEWIMKNKNKKKQKPNAVIDNSIGSYEKHPFLVKKTNEM